MVDRVIQDGRVTESSGLARSTFQRGVLFTHNDRGDFARVFAVQRDGRTRAVLTVNGARNRDWEDIAAGPNHSLWIADIGDNRETRGGVVIYRIEEPFRVTTGSVDSKRYRLNFPDGAHNAEALLVRPNTGRVYLVTKDGPGAGTSGAGIYRAPKSLSRSSVNQMVRVAAAPGSVTGGSFYPAGGRFVLRNYGSAFIYNGVLDEPRVLKLPHQEQGESVEVTADGSSILVGSEGEHSPIYRMR